MATKIFFDMDGTIANLYQKKGWFEAILNEEKGLFSSLEPMFTAEEISRITAYLAEMEKDNRVELEVITWTPMNASDNYCQIVAEEKREWLENYFPGFFSQIHILPYGVPKQYAFTKRCQNMILVDDNAEVLAMWETPKIRKGLLRTPTMTADELLEKLVNLG